jgi:outer membrane protein OmpA-like peptidoglycan-associated protein
MILVLSLTMACASKAFPPDEEMAISYALIEDARIMGGETYAPELMREAKSFYEKAEMELAAGNRDRAEELRQISEIRAKTVISMGRKRQNEEEVEKLRPELIEANSIKKAHENELRENVLKLEQIKDRLALSRDLMYSKALDTLERAGQKIEAAKSVSGYFSPQLLSQASETYKAAEESLNLGQEERSIEMAEKAIALAGKAFDESKIKYDLGEEIRRKISSIYGAKAEIIKGGVKVVFPGLFAPSGTIILFDFYPSLDTLATVLAEYPSLPVDVVAYTNDLKSEDDNVKLSQERADAVKDYMISRGLPPEMLKAVGLGVDKAIGNSGAVDRRVELIIGLASSDNI